MDGEELVIATMDYYKYFDSFHHDMLHLKFPPRYVRMMHDLYKNLHRTIKLGGAVGTPKNTYNGMGQGDDYVIFAALALTSVQCVHLQDEVPTVKLGSCVDDRNL